MRRRFSLGVELLCERLTLDASAITVVIPVPPPAQLPTIPMATLILDPWYDPPARFDPMDPNYTPPGPIPWFDPMGV